MARRKRAARPNKRFTPKMQRKLAMLFMGIGLAFITLIVRLIVINQRNNSTTAGPLILNAAIFWTGTGQCLRRASWSTM